MMTSPRKDLDAIFVHTPAPSSSLGIRLSWLADLLNWILSDSALRGEDVYFNRGETQALRVKWALHVLERRPEWRERVALVVQSLPHDTQVFDLLVMTGLHQQAGLFSEILERVQSDWLPRPKEDENLQYFFSNAFSSESDAQSFLKIDDETFSTMTRLFEKQGVDIYNRWRQNFRDACLFLAIQISGIGLSTELRRRLKSRTIDEISFYSLNIAVQEWAKFDDVQKSDELKKDVLRLIDISYGTVHDIYAQMDDHGVSIQMVYQLDRLEGLLRRLKVLLQFFSVATPQPSQVKVFISTLIFESVRSRSVRSLFDDNMAMIAKKIVENSAETGEHYIARTKSDYKHMLQAAWGGGIVTTGTVLIKLFLSLIPGSPFLMGFLASLNYSTSFLYMQYVGFTLATKQPAMTAAALAAKIRTDIQDSEMNELVNEIVYLVRSQVISVIGNVSAVIPTMILFCWTFQKVVGHPVMSLAKAQHTVHDFNLLGPTPLYAAFTGVVLFASSLAAGWFYNWVLFRRLHHGIAQSPRMIQIFGRDRMRKFGVLFKSSCSALAGNVSLGFFLGLLPVIFAFLGVPLDVRHVTLSSGMATAAIFSLPPASISMTMFGLMVGGIMSMAVLNLGVSFGLALTVAFRAKKIHSRRGLHILKNVVLKILKNPLILFWPKGKIDKIGSSPAA